jgi:hypothetical protein
VALGVICLLAGRGTWKVSKIRVANANFLRTWGRVLRVGGVVLIIVALIRLAAVLWLPGEH